jgi:PAS domain S-box-containing protein
MKTVSVKTFPSHDSAFAEHVARAREERGAWDAEWVVARIRAAYPDATATQASALAALAPETERWYVYRDGSSRAFPHDPSWADDESLPRAVVGPDGRYVDANDAAAALFGADREQIIGRRVGSFTAHEDDDEIGDRLLSIASVGQPVSSIAVLKRPEGLGPRIEFVVRPSGSDHHLVTMRLLADQGDAAASG